MHIEIVDADWLDEQMELSLSELAMLTDTNELELLEWVNEGIIAPVDVKAATWSFSAKRLDTINMARRLRRDFELDVDGLALIVNLLSRVRDLESQLLDLEAKIPKFRL
jgi:hypothetical protein